MFYTNRTNIPSSTPYMGPRVGRWFVHRSFQFKYILLLMSVVTIGLLIFLVPAYYFLKQNYEIFIKLAFRNIPGLVQHLEQESMWLIGFLFISFIATVGLVAIVATQLTRNLIAPLLSLEKHMKLVMNGQWQAPSVEIESLQDEFRELAITYDYLYRSLRAQAESDLRYLGQLTIDPNNRDAVLAYEKMVKQKKDQLGVFETVTMTEKGYQLAHQDRESKLVDFNHIQNRMAQSPSKIGDQVSSQIGVKNGVPSSRRAV